MNTIFAAKIQCFQKFCKEFPLLSMKSPFFMPNYDRSGIFVTFPQSSVCTTPLTKRKERNANHSAWFPI